MTTLLPRDDNDQAIPALALRPDGAHAIPAGAATARNAIAFAPGTRVVSLYATEPVFLRFGDAAVIASTSDHYFPAGIYYDVSLGDARTGRASHVAVLRAGGSDGTCYVSEKS